MNPALSAGAPEKGAVEDGRLQSVKHYLEATQTKLVSSFYPL